MAVKNMKASAVRARTVVGGVTSSNRKLLAAVKEALQSVLDEHTEKQSFKRKASDMATTVYDAATSCVTAVANWIANAYEFFVALAKQFVALCQQLLAQCVATVKAFSGRVYAAGARVAETTAGMLQRALGWCERHSDDAAAVLVVAAVACLAASAPAAAMTISRLAMAAAGIVFAAPIVRSLLRTAEIHRDGAAAVMAGASA